MSTITEKKKRIFSRMHTVVVRFPRHITHPYTFARPTNTPIYAYACNTFVVNPLALILTYMKTVQGEI